MKAFQILPKFCARYWRPALLVASIATIAYLLYFHKLSSLTNGYAPAEQATLFHSSDWHHIFDNPVNAPYSVIVWLYTAVLHLHQSDPLVARIVAACFGTLWALLFYAIARRWYGFRTAFLGTLLFATSSGFLHNARLGSAYVLQMAILACLGIVMLYKQQRNLRAYLGYILAAIFALLWYVPGMVWVLLLGIVLFRTSIVGQFSRMPRKHVVGWVSTAVVLIAPLLFAAVRNPNVLLDSAGLPHSIHSLQHFGTNLGHALLAIGIRSPGDPLLWISHTPLLTVTESVFLLLGIYCLVWLDRSYRSYFVLGALALCLLLIALGGTVSYASIVPLAYLVIARGVAHFTNEWTRVFPRNPIARLGGVLVVCTMLGFSVLYQVRSYFVAWPHTRDTQALFSSSAIFYCSGPSVICYTIEDQGQSTAGGTKPVTLVLTPLYK